MPIKLDTKFEILVDLKAMWLANYLVEIRKPNLIYVRVGAIQLWASLNPQFDPF